MLFDNPVLAALIAAIALILIGFVVMLAKRYKRCPSNRVLVIYGKVKSGMSAKCLHGGGAFVWPLIQDYNFLSLDPMQIEIPLRGALSAENIRVNVPSVFTVAVGTQEQVMNNAAERLLGLTAKEISKQSEDIIFGQLRQVIASMKIEDINRNRDEFLEAIHNSLAAELEKIGLVLINVNITDITDESGYIEAIGRKAASEAIQQAEIDVAVQQKKGAIGVAAAEKDKEIEVAIAAKEREIGTKTADRDRIVEIAELEKTTQIGQQTADYQQTTQIKEAERMMRVQVADENAKAVAGENLAKAIVAEADASLNVKQAEAYQRAETSKREADAAVNMAQYEAEAKAAEALARKIEQESRAQLEAKALAQKAKSIVDAEADAAQQRILAEGEAAAIYAKLEAQARGEYELLAKKADGLKRIVEGCGGSQQAFQLLMLEQLPQLSETAATAISNIKFDKIVVWDNGNGTGQGKGATANFLQNMAGSLPPMLNMMRDIGGIEMPEFLGKLVDGDPKVELPRVSSSEGAKEGDSGNEAKVTDTKPAKKSSGK